MPRAPVVSNSNPHSFRSMAGPASAPSSSGPRGSGPRSDRPGAGGPRGRGPRRDGPKDENKDGLIEKVVFINRCAKVVKGGRRFSFSALIVTGDKAGRVGCGFGKANEVAEAIRKGSEASRRAMNKVSVSENTIPHEVMGEHGGGRVLLRPASPGTGVIAGGGMRAVIEAVGIRDVLAKSLGSSNHANVVKATLAALAKLRLKGDIMKMRGVAAEVAKAA
ncbi:MAG: 30S ribosomal protein S5 [Verrucomicrobia bacterium]|nr:30S ribosomal protein S5 [Verrucomicrobiota bacterium]